MTRTEHSDSIAPALRRLLLLARFDVALPLLVVADMAAKPSRRQGAAR
jgi:hypothetical protein